MLYHLVGIGGIGMSSLALHLKCEGHEIYGSNLEENERVRYLKSCGVEVFKGHNWSNWHDPDVLIMSSAVKQENPEVSRALSEGVPVKRRMEVLNEVLKARRTIGVTGTDGKTTTTAMVSHMLLNAGMNPTVFLGGVHPMLQHGNYRNGDDLTVAEIDESDGYFRDTSTLVSVVTNIRPDHLEHYNNEFSNLIRSFASFMENARTGVVIFADEEVADIALGMMKTKFEKKRVLFFGSAQRSHIRLVDRQVHGKTQIARFSWMGKERTFQLRIPGVHNIYNALAALGALLILEYPADIVESLEDFRPVERRFQLLRSDEKENVLIEDYAHTPEEIEKTLLTAREVYGSKRLVVFFQPHRYTRLARENGRFANSLRHADEVHVVPIYDAYEAEIRGVSEEEIVEKLRELGVRATHHSDKWDVLGVAKSYKETVLLFLGAGDITEVARALLDGFW